MNEDSECKRLKIGNAPLLCKFNKLKAAIFGTLLSVTFRKAIAEKIGDRQDTRQPLY